MTDERVKVDLAEYKESDFKPLSWEDYGKTLEELYKKVSAYLKESDVKINAVVPILRGGAIPGTYLAFKLGLLRIIPIQYKYFFIGKDIKLKRVLDFPDNVDMPENPVFLLAENNQCFGLTAKTAGEYLKERFPGCRIVYATDHMDYSYQDFDVFDVSFYGKLTNETRKLTPEQCKKVGVENISYLFPWESLKEEFTTVKGKQFQYKDLKEVMPEANE